MVVFVLVFACAVAMMLVIVLVFLRAFACAIVRVVVYVCLYVWLCVRGVCVWCVRVCLCACVRVYVRGVRGRVPWILEGRTANWPILCVASGPPKVTHPCDPRRRP